MRDPDKFAAWLTEEVEGQRWGTGWQASVRTSNGSWDLCGGVDGVGLPVSPGMPFCVYCAGKPITAMCVAALVGRSEVSFDDRLGDILDRVEGRGLADVTVGGLLRHTAGLGHYPAHVFLAQPAQSRDRLLLDLEPLLPVGHTAYSEFAAWELLRLCIEQLSCQPFEKAVAEMVLAPIGLNARMRFTSCADELGLNVAVRAGVVQPLLWEYSETNLSEVKASTGLIASSAALADFYLALGEMLNEQHGHSFSALESMLTCPGGPTFDPALGRSCKLGAGFMVDLAGHYFGPLHVSSFGHSGLSGMTFAGCDPCRGVSFAVHVNGFLERDRSRDDRRSEERRRAIMSALVGQVSP